MLLAVVFIACGVFDAVPGFPMFESCFLNVGCFENGSPWTTLYRPALPPERPEKTHPFFYFYNRTFPHGIPYEIFPKPNFTNFYSESNKTSYVLVHGYNSSPSIKWIVELTDILLTKNDVNVFALDFSKGGGRTYVQAVGNMRLFGRIYAQAFVKTKIPSSKFHMIGHSLGAHLASYIAKEMKEMGHFVGWVTGLDPAAPLYENTPIKVRIDSTDAEFVDIHHTDSGTLGMLNPIGHVDFYYNGGTMQPCPFKITDPLGCGHLIVPTYYISSVKYDCIYGIPSEFKSGTELLASSIVRGTITKFNETSCTPSTCLQVGIRTKYFPQRGVFTVFLKIEPPFCSNFFIKDSYR